MKLNKRTEMRNEVVHLVRGFVTLMVSATTVAVVGGLILYWYIEDQFLSVSPFMSHVYALLFVGCTFHICAHSLFIFYFNNKFQNPLKKPKWLCELDQMTDKIVELEHQLAMVKTRTRSDGAIVDEKNHLLLRERDFNGELEGRISKIRAEINILKKSGDGNQLEKVMSELQDVLALIEKNREYLLIAA